MSGAEKKPGSASRRIRPWSDQEIETLRREWMPGQGNDALAAWMGRPACSVRAKAGRLGLTRRKGFAPWSRGEDELLRELTGQMSISRLAGRLGRSVNAVRVRSAQLRVSWQDRDGWYTARDAGEIMGVDARWVTKRIEEGALPASPAQGGDTSQKCGTDWWIERKDLRAFLRRHSHELMGRNLDIVQIVEILAGLEYGKAFG